MKNTKRLSSCRHFPNDADGTYTWASFILFCFVFECFEVSLFFFLQIFSCLNKSVDYLKLNLLWLSQPSRRQHGSRHSSNINDSRRCHWCLCPTAGGRPSSRCSLGPWEWAAQPWRVCSNSPDPILTLSPCQASLVVPQLLLFWSHLSLALSSSWKTLLSHL